MKVLKSAASVVAASSLVLGYASSAQAAPAAQRVSAPVSAASTSTPGASHMGAESDSQYMKFLMETDFSRASDAQLAQVGVVAVRDISGKVTGYRVTEDTRQLLIASSPQLLKTSAAGGDLVKLRAGMQGSFVEWAKCAGGLALFIGTTFIPAGKLGTIAIRSIGIIKRWGIKKTITILKRFGRAQNVTEAQFFKDFSAAILGFGALQPCKKALGW